MSLVRLACPDCSAACTAVEGINVVVCAAQLTPHWWSVTLTDVTLTRVRESYRVTWRRLTPCRCGHHATDTRCHVDGCSC